MDELKTRKRNMWMFPLGTVGRDMMYNLVTNFLLTYILFTKGLNAAQLGAITAIMVAARVFDALNDPIMGNIIENTHTKWGKFKPWMVIGTVLSCIVVFMVFSSNLKDWQFVALFAVFYFCYSIALFLYVYGNDYDRQLKDSNYKTNTEVENYQSNIFDNPSIVH